MTEGPSLPQGPLVLGIDEAGRGPVLGPMIVCGLALGAADIPRLAAMGVKDSKVLSPARREALAAAIEALGARIHLVEIPPARLDAENLTEVELGAFAECIREASPAAVYADAPVGPRAISRFRERLRAAVAPLAPELVLENRADSRFPVVSAASILAKVRRDLRIRELQAEYGEIGSGYPGDPVTRRFLAAWMAAHAEPPPIARRKWATFKRLKQERFDF